MSSVNLYYKMASLMLIYKILTDQLVNKPSNDEVVDIDTGSSCYDNMYNNKCMHRSKDRYGVTNKVVSVDTNNFKQDRYSRRGSCC